MNNQVENICVDLDGTLVRTDTLIESLFLFIKKNPVNLFKCLVWLWLGKSRFKERLARQVDLNVDTLPYNAQLLAYLKDESATKKIHLCTAANHKIAESIARHIGIFSSIFASDNNQNLRGQNKADRLVNEFGEKGFVYAGNEQQDMAIWKHAAAAIVVTNSTSLIRKVKKTTPVIHHYPAQTPGISKYLRSLRLHQWVKNILIFIPLFLAHKYTDISSYIDVMTGFVAFGLIASVNYMLNDLADLDSDRRHATKRNRPFASGELPIATGLVLIPFLLIVGLTLSYLVGMDFLLYITVYLFVTLVYTYIAKSIVILDIIVLAVLYTIRLVAGAAAVHEPVTFWLLAYSLFMFFSLASVKRYTEIIKLDPKEKISGRGYVSEDASFVKSLGVSSGLISVLVFALYINDPGIIAKYSSPSWLWLITPMLLYWVARIWHLTYHGMMHEDPVVFAIKDKVSYVVAALSLIGILLAV